MPRISAANIRPEVMQLAYFHTAYVAGDIAIWTYYTALLLRAANYSIDIVVLNLAASFFGVLIGFFVCGLAFSRLGYTWSYRASNILFAVICIVSLLTLPNILQVHMFIGFFRGVGTGLFWMPHHIFNLKDIGGENRKHMYGKLLASVDLIAILLPPLAGALINLQGYDWLFGLGTIFYLGASFMRWQNIPQKQEVLKWSEIKAIPKKRGFKPWAAITYLEEVFLQFRNISLIILPFLLLDSEFEVGIFLGIIGFFSAIIKVWEGYRTDHQMFKFGLIGGWIVVLSNLFLIVFWNLPGLIIRSIVSKVGFAFFDQAKIEFKYRQREMLLGDFRRQYSLEIQEYAETFMFLARVTAVAVVLLGLHWLQVSSLALLLIVFAISAFREVVGLWFDAWLVRYLRR